MDSRAIAKHRRRLTGKRSWFTRWLSRSSANALARDGSADAVRILADVFASETNSDVCEITGAALRTLTRQSSIDAVCACWHEKRPAVLTALLKQRGWQAAAPIDLRIVTSLKLGQFDSTQLTPDCVEPLVRAADDVDREIAGRAMQVLSALQRPAEIEVLCELMLRFDDSRLRRLAIEKGYAPRDPGKRALFYFLTGQWERYETLDFDQQLLRTHYETADDALRQTIAARVRASGRPELARVLQGRRDKRHLRSMSGREWEAVVTVLSDKHRYDDLWTVVFEAPSEWSAEALAILKQAGYRPAGDGDEAMFDRLWRFRPADGRQSRLFWPVPACRLVLKAHDQGIRAVAFSPDATILVTGANDLTVRLWDVATGQVKRILSPHAGAVLSVAFSPDGRLFAAGFADHTVRLWETLRWQMIVTLHGHEERVTTVAFSPDGTMLASGGFDQTARLWDLGTKQCSAVLAGHTRSILTSAFSPDGRFLATGSHDETVRLWYALSGENKALYNGYASSVCVLAFSPDGRSLAAGSSDGLVRFRHVASGDLQNEITAHKGTVAALAFSSDGKRLATGGLDRVVRLWDMPSRQLKATLGGHTDEVNALAFTSDGKRLATAGRDKSARLWELAVTKPIGAMTQEDLLQIERWAQVLPNHEEARGFHYVAAALRHRFRTDIDLEQIAGRLLGEFDIELEPSNGIQDHSGVRQNH